MSGINIPFPPTGTPFLGPSGAVSDVWLRFLLTLFNRTGTSSGVDSSVEFEAVKTRISEVASETDTATGRITAAEADIDSQQAALAQAGAVIAALMQRLAWQEIAAQNVAYMPPAPASLPADVARVSDVAVPLPADVARPGIAQTQLPADVPRIDCSAVRALKLSLLETRSV